LVLLHHQSIFKKDFFHNYFPSNTDSEQLAEVENDLQQELFCLNYVGKELLFMFMSLELLRQSVQHKIFHIFPS
jgi:hypothetical protein